MKHYLLHDQQGQTLLQFAFLIVALFTFVALAVDVGNVYAERRTMQNAADAAALAAARELCLQTGNAAAIAKARDYLMRNGVAEADIQAGDITIEGNRVRVTARETATTFIAGLIGIDTVDVAAVANSACGGANSTCSLWPIAFEYAIYDGVQCGESMVIWDADNDNDKVTCEIGGVPRDICDCYDCDLDDDGSNDFAVMTDISRGWMDFPDTSSPVFKDFCASNGCGASELACRLLNDYTGRIELPACIAGLRGVKAGVKDEVNSRSGEFVGIPLFTSINCGGSESHCTGKEAESYYVTKFGCVSVSGWIHSFTLNPKPGMPKSYHKITTKAILVTKDCSGKCFASCGATDGTPAQPWEVRAASLIQ
ncbi:MAG: pilus assembly protein [Caldilineaceae bacterium]|nr:pilus assembly protein [Caldilineaceae bacterium]